MDDRGLERDKGENGGIERKSCLIAYYHFSLWEGGMRGTSKVKLRGEVKVRQGEGER